MSKGGYIMPKFLTISPTHIPGKKEYAWKNFDEGCYIAIGWMNVDLSGKSIEEITEIIRKNEFPNEASAIDAFKKFFELDIGDIVAVNNANHGLFGVGEITSDYFYEENKHDYGGEGNDGYSHLRSVNWLFAKYVRRKDLITSGETGWSPYGTVGAMHLKLPPYIERLLGRDILTPDPIDELIEPPSEFEGVLDSINSLRADPDHLERAHESIVEEFLVALGYVKHKNIRYQRNRLDISIWDNQIPQILFEVKRDWDISQYTHQGAIKQAYNYALEYGIRYVVVTNGDDYIVFDRMKGLSLNSNSLGFFKLTALQQEDIELINKLRQQSIATPDIKELFINLSEAFHYPGDS